MDARLEPVRWRSAPLSDVYDRCHDLTDISEVDLADLRRMLVVADVVIAYTGGDRSQYIILRGDAERLDHPETKVGGVRCASVCQRLAVAAMTVLIDYNSLGLPQLPRCGELLEQAGRCPSAVAEWGAAVACLAREKLEMAA